MTRNGTPHLFQGEAIGYSFVSQSYLAINCLQCSLPGLALIVDHRIIKFSLQECIEIVGNNADITEPHTMFWLRVLFGRMRSRWVGAATGTRVPVALRSSLYGLFAWRYGVALEARILTK